MQDALPQFLRDLAKAEQKHRERCERYDQCDRIYDGKLEPWHLAANSQDEAGEWRSSLHPPYVFEKIQAELAMLLDDKPIASVKPPRGKPELKDKAQAYENKLNEDRREDNYDEKIAGNYLQALQRGVSCVKTSWAYEFAKVRQNILTPVYGQATPARSVEAQDVKVFDRPTITVCDMKDVMWDPAATSPDTITTLFYRTYETKASLKAMQADGLYENVDDVVVGGNGTTDRPGYIDRKDLVEVWERWQHRRDGIQLTVVASRTIVMRDQLSPYVLNGKEIPFSFVAPTPRLFRIDGKSEPELIADIQVALWRNKNARLDQVELVNNNPFFARDSEQDTDAWTWAPGAVNLTNGNPADAVMPWSPNTSIFKPSLDEEQVLKGDMETISGVNPFVSGSETSTIDQKTATAVKAIQSMAQRRILMKKQKFANQERQIGKHQLLLNEQLAPDVVPGYGPNGEPMPLQIQDIIGCTYEVEDADESLNRQERRQEASLMLQTIAGLMALPQFGMIVNAKAILEDFFESYDVDPEAMLVEPPPPAPMGVPGLGGGLASTQPGQGVPLGAVPTTPSGAGAPSSIPFGRPAA